MKGKTTIGFLPVLLIIALILALLVKNGEILWL